MHNTIRLGCRPHGVLLGVVVCASLFLSMLACIGSNTPAPASDCPRVFLGTMNTGALPALMWRVGGTPTGLEP